MTTIKRAFELARSGQCRSIEDIRRQLRNERHDRIDEHLAARSLQKQLRDAIKAANTAPNPLYSGLPEDPPSSIEGPSGT
jgi:hypothetical protein